mmetsp:Transcript_91613/g.158851  ORF Transcript_91613/g.158851 Transcript_91613/m.158851 type:complete len:107 (-) Transcript_91613:90-410(-)
MDTDTLSPDLSDDTTTPPFVPCGSHPSPEPSSLRLPCGASSQSSQHIRQGAISHVEGGQHKAKQNSSRRALAPMVGRVVWIDMGTALGDGFGGGSAAERSMASLLP